MAELEWWMKSPSPWTLCLWLVFAVWITRKLLLTVKYRRLKKLNAFTDSLFIVGFVTLIGDVIWTTTCLFRFGWFFSFYPDVYQLILCIARDAVGIIFCYILLQPLFKFEVLSFNSTFLKAVLCNVIFMVVWFAAAPSPAFIDWNYAIRFDYPSNLVLADFLMSHVLGRVMLFTMLFNIFN